MIDIAMSFVTDYLNRELNKRLGRPNTAESLKLKNLQKESAAEDVLIISLIHIEEDKTFKNQDHLRRFNADSDKFDAVNPEMRLNLFALATAFFKEKNYSEGLKQLSYLITILQGKNVFDEADLKAGAAPLSKIIIDLHPLSLEQNNTLWQTIGLTIYPSVMYKIRVVELFDKKSLGEVAEIRTVGIDINSKQSP